jgi:hypothetical protein
MLVPFSRTGLVEPVWWNQDQQAARQDHLVFHLPAKLSPPLVEAGLEAGLEEGFEEGLEDGLIESGFLLDVPTWLFDSAGNRSGHIAHLDRAGKSLEEGDQMASL